MPNPCTSVDDPTCFGPFRVQFTVTLPEGYEDVWVPPPGGGIPIARVSEVNVALLDAFNAEPADTTATLTTTGTAGGPVVTTATVQTGVGNLFRGPANPEPVDVFDTVEQVWTAEVWVSAPEPLSASMLDHAYVAGEWLRRVEGITTGAGVDGTLNVDSVWIGIDPPYEQLDPAYPGSAGHEIEVAAAG